MKLPKILLLLLTTSSLTAADEMKLTIQGRPEHPTVYLDRADIARAQKNRQTSSGKAAADKLIKEADEWANRSDEQLRSYIPKEGACFAYGFSGCPICNAGIGGWWGTKGCATLDDPGHVKCDNGHRLPDEKHPDSGEGWTDPTGKKFYFVGEYNSFVVDTLTNALTRLVYAYALTGETKYAEKAALVLDELARVYPSCDKGSWDYPSTPPSGRFNRPWYQVARKLVNYSEDYDILLMGDALDKPSSIAGLTRRQNIEKNLLLNGAKYCYDESRAHPSLTNGQCDYIRGCMVVGVVMGIPEYVKWAVDGPWSFHSMIANNIDRDGAYYETSSGYSHHSRYLYMDCAQILHNYRDANYPDGIKLVDDPRFRACFTFPQSRLTVAGFLVSLGDDGTPDKRVEASSDISPSDLMYVENLRALARDREWPGVTAKPQAAGEDWWLLFHSDSNAALTTAPSKDFTHPLTNRPISASDLLTQKGVAVLRSGEGSAARGVTFRFGPTLNHGHLDEMGINIYALGNQLTYDLGYGLGSTHTQVGWSHQTASHCTVLVNEKSQIQSDGAGGSAELFFDLPGLKLAQADDPACYSSEKVSKYQRTVAMIDASPEESYIIDIFRIAGGNKHDYNFHSRGTKFEISDLKLSEAQPGSLAGADVDWGSRLGIDGDVKGISNKPYWNPPPGNGLGFMMSPRSAEAKGIWSATWNVDDGANIRLTMLPLAKANVTVAEAPGIYPKYPKATYVLSRRAGENLSTTYAAVIEPFGAKRFIRDIQSLTDPLEDADAAVGMKISLADDRVDYILQCSQRKKFGEIEFSGGFAKIETHPARVENPCHKMVLIGGTFLRAFGVELSMPQASYDGKIDRINFDKCILYTSTKFPQKDFAGQMISIGSKSYSRQTAYRISHIDREGELSAIHLLPTTFILGKGHIEKNPTDEHSLPNLVPLEYAKAVRGKASDFFRGKVVSNGKAVTRITTVANGGMAMKVESTLGFSGGDDLIITDIQAGDSFSIACFAQIQRQENCSFEIVSNADARVHGK